MSGNSRLRPQLNSPLLREPTILTPLKTPCNAATTMAHRSPVIFWLLVAATLAINAVATYELSQSQDAQVVALFTGLMYGQFSLVCVWVVADRRSGKLRLGAPMIAAFIAALLISWATAGASGEFDWPMVIGLTVTFSLHMGVLWGLLWFFAPAAWVSGRGQAGKKQRQFSTLHLLILMTVVAVVLSLLRVNSDPEGWVIAASFTLANAVLLFGVLATMHRPWHLMLRAAAALALAASIGWICEWTQFALADWMDALAFFIVQAIVLIAWLANSVPASKAIGVQDDSQLSLAKVGGE